MAGKINVRVSNQLWRVGVPEGGDVGNFLQKVSSTDYDLEWVSGVEPAAHTIASHSDTSGTGAELDTLTDGSDADALHMHTAFGDYTETLKADTTIGNTTIDLADGTVQRWILDAARQFTMPTDPGPFGKSFVLILEPATHAVTWEVASPVLEWLTSDGAAPTLVTDANLVNVLTFIWDDVDSRWLGFLGGVETA